VVSGCIQLPAFMVHIHINLYVHDAILSSTLCQRPLQFGMTKNLTVALQDQLEEIEYIEEMKKRGSTLTAISVV